MKWMIATTESFQKGEIPPTVAAFLARHSDPFIILDESSKIKTNFACKEAKKSKRTQAIKKLNQYGERSILTGTFMSTSPVNAYDQMEFLCENFWGENMYSFESRYCIMIRLPIGRGIRTLIPSDMWEKMHKRMVKAQAKGDRELDSIMQTYTNTYSIAESRLRVILENEEYKPFINLDELYKRIEKCTMIVRKEDVLDLPDKVFVTVKVDMSPAMKKAYNDVLNSAIVGEVVFDGLSMYHRLQEVCNGYIPLQDGTKINEKTGKEVPVIVLDPRAENAKLDALSDYLEDIDIKRHRVIVWSNRKKILKDAAERLTKEGYRVAVYDGDTSDDEKESIKKRFLEGEIDVFIGNQKSGAYGLDWLKSATYAIYISNDSSSDVRSQADDRIHRGGCGKDNKIIVDIVIGGSIDEKVMVNLRRGIELIKSGKTDASIFALDEEDDIVF